MDGLRRFLVLLISVGVVSISGAQCPNMIRQYTAPEPRALPPSPTLDEVIQVVNRNSSRIYRFSTTDAKLSSPSFPALRANIAFERPRRFRLLAEIMNSPELDLGSNDRFFWFWIKRSQPPAVYYCRHEEFSTGAARRVVPIDPDWLIEALGIAEFDPALPHQGPDPLPGNRNRLQIRTVRDTPEGTMIKTTVVDAVRGWVLEQHIRDPHGRVVASAVAEGHRRDPATNLVMPTAVKLHCPVADPPFSMRVDLGRVRINPPTGSPAELWTMPTYPGAPLVDLGNPQVPLSPPAAEPLISARPRSGVPRWDSRPH
jgi:hypothetical protein